MAFGNGLDKLRLRRMDEFSCGWYPTSDSTVFAAFFLLIMGPDEIIRELNAIGYDGPLSVEWEDSGMDREYGARKVLEYWHRGQTLFIA